jgi:hypothetical protein
MFLRLALEWRLFICLSDYHGDGYLGLGLVALVHGVFGYFVSVIAAM